MMVPNADQNVLIPIKLDAFVLNDKVCDGGYDDDELRARKAKIAPISQPNYSFLRLKKSYLQSDILYHTDLHNACPADFNSRITDLGSRSRRENRQGIYLHWTLPRIYRSGSAATSDAEKGRNGLPIFPEVPTRWLVVRHIHDLEAVEPREAKKKLKSVSAWVVESDRCRTLDGERKPEDDTLKEPWNVLDGTVDLQVDVSPFVSASDSVINGGADVLEKQAEIFIGDKRKASEWKETQPEDGTTDTSKSRVNLQLLSSSNELFPDYQPHNSNVFSIVDNFEYDRVDIGDNKTKPLYASRVPSVSYSVLGWHSKPQKDIVWLKGKSETRAQLLKRLDVDFKGFHPRGLDFDAIIPQEIVDWLDECLPRREQGTRSLCHGALYDVSWDLHRAPEVILADKYAEMLSQKLPVAVGTTPMDALMAYAGAHEADTTNPNDDVKKIESALKRLETVLLSRDDGVEAHAQGADMMYNWNYTRLDGGQQYHVSGGESGGKPTIPEDKRPDLIKLNDLCRFRDAADRKLKRQRWAVFAEWWQAVTLAKKELDVKNALKPILDSIDALEKLLGISKQDLISVLTDGKKGDEATEFEPGVHPPFHQQRDPTLLVGGVRSGWEPDYLHTLLIRLDTQLIEETKAAVPREEEDGWGSLFKEFVTKKMPEPLRASAQALLREFVVLRTRRRDEDDGTPKTPSFLRTHGFMGGISNDDSKKPERRKIGPEMPTFHDRQGLDHKGKPVWRDSWNNTQPWFPLFLEWEVEYTHIDHEDWELAESKWWHSEGAKLHYAIKPDMKLEDKYGDKTKKEVDKRRFSGRALILPQPSFSLEAKILQLFSDTAAEKLEKLLPCKDREALAKSLRKFDFLSAPLSGFNSHMLTVEQGNHVKPSIRDPVTGAVKFMGEAARKEAGLSEQVLENMGIETDLTPYGRSKSKPDDDGPAVFKPVTHGQFRITKLNIIDKFGQAIHAIDPKPTTEELTPKLYPCISDWYAPQAKSSNPESPNVVGKVKKENETKCEYIQVPPQINQPARLNAVFTIPSEPHLHEDDPKPPFWRATHDWDQPIWGWVVVNYANFGVQFFLPSGAFYREVRCAGPTGALLSPEWLPFEKPDDPSRRGGKEDGGAAAKQLARLVKVLGENYPYLRRFIATINAATTSIAPAPSAYAEFRSALLGRPLALTYFGVSLELAGSPWKSHLSKDNTPKKTLLDYEFRVKLGDRERGFDGLVGYFPPLSKSELKEGNALDVSTFYTHFPPGVHDIATEELAKISPPASAYEDEQPNPTVTKIITIKKDNYPLLKPYYLDPDNNNRTPASYAADANEKLAVFGALLDPFLPVHAYTGILPVKEFSLPTWTWQGALDKLSAFFHAGPVLITGDVPEFVEARQLKQGDLPPKVVEGVEGEEKQTVGLPGGALGMWSWLQPYDVDEVHEKSITGDEEEAKPREKFMPLAVEVLGEESKLERGPYTAIEGYLQMAAGVNEK
ncbi:hypothetical protein J3E68DRAFT_99163 [Trichoderma sp. SZMC 28012]